MKQEGAERLFFVVESKASLFPDDLRPNEAGKITCGKAHFAALAASHPNPACFTVARNPKTS
ncbi:MAG TPA: hypothetical protein VN709_07125 [Terriglobales bacterium]|nr:hypothetical protein [Terriglobales bacterium]